MKVQIKNLGAVKDATVDLGKKLNVFCGGNSTGKTYMAYIIYAITSLENKSYGPSLDPELISRLTEDRQVTLKINIDEIYAFKKEEEEKIKPNLWRLFSIPENKSDDFFSKTEIVFSENKTEFEQKIKQIRLNDTIKFSSYSISVIKEHDLSIDIKLSKETIVNANFIRQIDIAFLSVLYGKLIYYPIMSSAVFPVERNSIFTFSRELSIKKNERFELIEKLSTKKEITIGELISSSNRYPQPIRDCLKVADDLETIKKTNSVFYTIAEEMENELLEGKVIIGDEGNVEFSSIRASKNKSLSFHQSSSIVKTLSGLVIYLKHIAQKNDLVIIDEPELNLHPDNQIKITRIIARLINEGLNFVISTHSDYILREINNLIMLSSEDENINVIRKKYGFVKSEFLQREDIGVHYFHYRQKKMATVDSIEVGEFGFEIPSIDREIEKQNNITDELYYTLKFGSGYE